MSPEIALMVTLAVLVAIWIFLLRDALRALRPAKLMLEGRYAEAREAAGRLSRSWMKIFPSVRSAAHYTIASSLHLEGELEASLEAVRAIDRRKLDRSMTYAAASIEAANLVLLDRDPRRVVSLLEGVKSIRHAPEDMLLLAHAKLATGERDEADELVERAKKPGEERRIRLGKIMMLEGKDQKEAIFHALRGLYLHRAGRSAEATRDLELAAKSPILTFYVARARELLPKTADDEGDGPSSLAPQVLGQIDRD